MSHGQMAVKCQNKYTSQRVNKKLNRSWNHAKSSRSRYRVQYSEADASEFVGKLEEMVFCLMPRW